MLLAATTRAWTSWTPSFSFWPWPWPWPAAATIGSWWLVRWVIGSGWPMRRVRPRRLMWCGRFVIIIVVIIVARTTTALALPAAWSPFFVLFLFIIVNTAASTDSWPRTSTSGTTTRRPTWPQARASTNWSRSRRLVVLLVVLLKTVKQSRHLFILGHGD